MCADKQKKLLLVEDEPIIAMMQSRILTNNNYHVVIAYSGEQAVELFEDYNDINLILMDIDLGYGMDGTEAAKIILEKQDIPLVFLSSHTEQEIVSKTENITSYGYIVKNTEETVLLASINMAFKLFESRLKEKEKEKALELSENRYFSLFDNISSGVAIYKVIDDGNDFIFHDLNKASIEIEGFIKEEIIGKSVLTVRSDIIRFGLLDVFKRVWKTGKPEYFPLKVYKEQNLDKYFDNY
ncbi:MAG: response regulator, partial [Candidatus Cloacimonetes bacterium]|nr:response regulator [Candidatus Cloacimonadota bacterium]